MKLPILILIAILLSGHLTIAQVGIKSDNSLPHPSAMLDVGSSSRGLLIPRMTKEQRDSIVSPAEGLMIYCIDCGFEYKPVLNLFSRGRWNEFRDKPNPNFCEPVTVNHAAGAVAPVSKTVTYGTVIDVPGEPAKCWITQNLGSSHQASSWNDNTEASSGWYWQFDNRQGFMNTGSLPTTPGWYFWNPPPAWNWQIVNDPCRIELGTTWRVPTITEWSNILTGGNWIGNNDAWYSGLKMHAGGRLNKSTGDLLERGSFGYFWSSTMESAYNAYDVHLWSTCNTGYDHKCYGYTLRCVREYCPVIAGPSASSPTRSTVFIIWRWNPAAQATGYRWSANNDFATATDIGTNLSKTETGLTCGTNYTRYVWAYDICGNSAAVALTASTRPCGSFLCGTDSLELVHLMANGVAPVNKTTRYGTFTNLPGEPTKCWITKNLGADHQAINVADATESSAGWYWQFNRKQGYRHDGTNRTPNTPWITNISENNDWVSSNDPCNLEIDSSWHVPTRTEWDNVRSSGSWTNWNSTWNSALRLHAAGDLETNGNLLWRGSGGSYWTSVQDVANSSTAAWLGFNSSDLALNINSKTYGFSVRCLKENCPPPPSPQSAGHVQASTFIIWKWHQVAGATGYKWNVVNTYSTAMDVGQDTSKTESGLTCGTGVARYVWAYDSCSHSPATALGGATAACGTFVCGLDSIIVIHDPSDTVAPVAKQVHYGTTTNIPGETGKCWITSNLGATHQANNPIDDSEASAGWYWQFNRKQGRKYDGTPTPAWTITGIDENSDWMAPNDPCHIELGEKWRIPTFVEWANVSNAGGWTNSTGPWNSALKLHCGGWVNTNGDLNHRGYLGVFWTSVQSDNSNAKDLLFNDGFFAHSTGIKAEGFPLRCIKDTCLASPTSPSTGTHILNQSSVVWNWNPVVGAIGYKWNTSNDYLTATDMGLSTSKTENNLTCNTAYTRYVWAYNHCSPSSVTTLTATTSSCPPSFPCGTDSLLIVHAVSNGVAPVDKVTKYGIVTNIPGEPSKCWISSNLGSDHQATAINDNSEASAGWYWQFNRKQGRKYDTIPTPAWTINAINENSNWLISNDPCRIELGGLWRIPTYVEWTHLMESGVWTNGYGPWNSELKLHFGGWVNTAGALQNRGSLGVFWTSVQHDYNHANARDLVFDFSIFMMSTGIKAEGFPLRCIKERSTN